MHIGFDNPFKACSLLTHFTYLLHQEVVLRDLLISCHTLGRGNSPNRNDLFQINLPINWHGITLTGTMAYKCFSQGNLIDLNTFDGNARLYMTDGFCRVKK